MARKGKDFENLIHAIENAWLESDDVQVESPKFVKDKTTGQMREFDVLITVKTRDYTNRIGIECRQRASKVASPEVEAFRTKCIDTDINKGIIVSSKGFSAPALKKAEAHNIECHVFEEALSANWIAMKPFEKITRYNDSVSYTVCTKHKELFKDCDFELIDRTGIRAPSSSVFKIMLPHLKRKCDEVFSDIREPGPYEAVIKFNTPGLRITKVDSEENYAVDRIDALVKIRIQKEFVNGSLYSRKNKNTDEVLSEAATFPIEMNGIKANLVFTNRPDEGTKVMVVRSDENP